MPGLTLLNIDRSLEESSDPLKDIKNIITEIYDFSKKFPGETMSARLVPLKSKLRQLQDIISQFGSDGSIDVNEKQSTIMQLHTELQLLANALIKYKGTFSAYAEICSNYLLNHLCTTAAVDPRATVIGVSNTMAQVLSNDIQLIEDPKFDITEFDPKYFETFSLKFNHMLTIAGLFAAPVLGLPDIPISQLGSWSDQALSQFAAIYRFVDAHYKPLKFYRIEKDLKATPFDTTGDILSFYIYANDFFAALIARADLLSGLEFPKEFTRNQKTITLQSTAQINGILAEAIEINCDIINRHILTIEELYNKGIIDRNENPAMNSELVSYQKEAEIWRLIAQFAKLLQQIFDSDDPKDIKIEKEKREMMIEELMGNDELPTIQMSPMDIELELVYFIYKVYSELETLYPAITATDVSDFIASSDFTKFRKFLQYIIHVVAAHDIFLDLDDIIWTPWLNSKFGKFYLESTTAFNPLGALEAGILSIMLGIKNKTRVLTNDGISMLKTTKQYLEFQLHNYFAIEVITALVKIPIEDLHDNVGKIIELIDTFLDEFQISVNSLLYQRANLYKGMLTIYQMPQEDEGQDLFNLMNSRMVTFDSFSWLLVPKNFKPTFPYIPLNTSLANLNAG